MPPPQGGLGAQQKPNIPPAPASWDDEKRVVDTVNGLWSTGHHDEAISFWNLYRKLKGYIQ